MAAACWPPSSTSRRREAPGGCRPGCSSRTRSPPGSWSRPAGRRTAGPARWTPAPPPCARSAGTPSWPTAPELKPEPDPADGRSTDPGADHHPVLRDRRDPAAPEIRGDRLVSAGEPDGQARVGGDAERRRLHVQPDELLAHYRGQLLQLLQADPSCLEVFHRRT